MKKVLALVLAVMMMATVAFAATSDNPGANDVANVGKTKIPGSKIEINDSGIIGTSVPASDVKSINSTNYVLQKVQWEEGKNLVESVKFDDANDKLVIKLKQDYTMTTEKKLAGTITLKGKKNGKGERPEDLTIYIGKTKDGNGTTPITVGYVLADGKGVNPSIQINSNNEADVSDGTDFDLKANEKYLWKVTDNGAKYGTLEFDAADDGDTNVEVRVYDGDKLYLYNTVDADTDILKAYADVDADITFLNFKGAPTFNSTATVRFYKPEDSYVYAVKDGKLTNVNAKWNDEEGCFVLKTRTLGSYVFSDKKLNVAAADASTNNPDTGANDVVGIAGALAAVALVSAAAVSLKK